jgi:CheY-like chemotaxis protein
VQKVAPPEPGLADRAWIEFAIEDSGIGIAPEKQAHIFSGFSQAEASTTRRFGGSGLGLAISKRLIQLMGGSLTLRSKLGQGSTFSFTLPLPSAPPQADDPADAPSPFPIAKRVLIVDDNPAARNILSTMTRSWSWPTDTASGGAHAIDMIRAQLSSDAFPYDVIYLDWQMPEMDGWETARQIRALCSGRNHPRIVMLTANGRDTPLLRTALEQSTVDCFLYKPVLAHALKDAASGNILQDARLQRSRRRSDRPLAGMRILVVEDNLINQQVAEELLNAEGAQVSLAANGQLGVDAVVASHPPFDVVLMDIQMPVLDGYGATRKIREQLGLTKLPILAMTANALASDRLACLAAGMNEHVGKPFDTGQLVALLLKVTGWKVQVADLSSPPIHAPQGSPSPVSEAVSVAQTSTVLSGPYLDFAVALERLSGLTELYLDIAREYVKSLDAVEGEFRQAAAHPQWSVLTAQMHSLKGISATLGAQALSEHAARLEKLYRAPPPDLLALEQLPELLTLTSATRDAIQSAIRLLASEEVEGHEQVPDRLLAGPVERAQALAFLSVLVGLLATNDLAALDCFATRGHALDALSIDGVEELQVALQSLNLERARQLCEAHMQNLAEY